MSETAWYGFFLNPRGRPATGSRSECMTIEAQSCEGPHWLFRHLGEGILSDCENALKSSEFSDDIMMTYITGWKVSANEIQCMRRKLRGEGRAR